jgi:uncharacterized membrane protein (UPF0127 family)
MYTQPLNRVGIFVPILKGWVFLSQFGGRICMILIKKGQKEIIAENLMTADSFLKRLKGLMFTKELLPQSALYIYPCREIHTFFMNYNIDVLYLDINNIIVALDEDMKPGKIGKHVKSAVAVVELPSGKIKETCIAVGQAIEFISEE